jgi:hypothetical protein
MTTFDPEAAVRYLTAHAKPASVRKCAQYTRRAIDAGFGVATVRETRHAQDYGLSLERAGFREIRDVVGLSLKPGDVVVIQGWSETKYRKENPDGHMAMWTGTKWVSDFSQRSLYPGPDYRKWMPSYRIYRHPDGEKQYQPHRAQVGFKGELP